MNRVTRNRLVGLLLGAFDSHAKLDAMLWLDLCCERSTAGERAGQLLVDLTAAWERRYPDAPLSPENLRALLGSLEGLLEIVGSDGRLEENMAVSAGPNLADSRVRLHPDLLSCFSAARERIRIYLSVLEQVDGQRATLEGMEPLHRAVAEAAFCFNARLFFEAHEHLEHHWAHLPRGATKRFVQGIIQVSVGFHHASRGSYDGAVNQLAKGLTKLAEVPGDALGLDHDRFLRSVRAAREEIVARGRQRMRQAALDELPRMHLLGGCGTPPHAPAAAFLPRPLLDSRQETC